MNCPTCKTENAYVGANVIECVSTECRHFSQRQKDEVWPFREPSKQKSLMDGLDAICKALEAGSYNAAPGELKQGCSLVVEDFFAWDDLPLAPIMGIMEQLAKTQALFSVPDPISLYHTIRIKDWLMDEIRVRYIVNL